MTEEHYHLVHRGVPDGFDILVMLTVGREHLSVAIPFINDLEKGC